MTAQWEDEYRKGALVGSGLKLQGLRLRVHRHIHYSPTAWLLSCPQINCDNVELGDGIPLEAAKCFAITRALIFAEGLRRELLEHAGTWEEALRAV